MIYKDNSGKEIKPFMIIASDKGDIYTTDEKDGELIATNCGITWLDNPYGKGWRQTHSGGIVNFKYNPKGWRIIKDETL